MKDKTKQSERFGEMDTYYDFGVEKCGACQTPLQPVKYSQDMECPTCGAYWATDARPEIDYRG